MKAIGGTGWLLRSQQGGGAKLAGKDAVSDGQHGIEYCTCSVRAHCAGWPATGSMATAPSAHRVKLNARTSDKTLRTVPDQLMLDVFSPPDRPLVCDLRHAAVV